MLFRWAWRRSVSREGDGPERVLLCEGRGGQSHFAAQNRDSPLRACSPLRLLEKTPNAPRSSFVPEAFRDALETYWFSGGVDSGR